MQAHVNDRSAPSRTMFTFLLGSGCSISAGVPSTSRLVRVMRARLKLLEQAVPDIPSWSELLDEVADDPQVADTDGKPPAVAYPELLANCNLFPFAYQRQAFITDVIRWSATRHLDMNDEALLLASILSAGTQRPTGGREPNAAAHGLAGAQFAHTVYTTNFDEILPQTFRYCGLPVAVIDHPGAHGRLHDEPRYPRVVYLHGCHLFYNLRNTEDELMRPDPDRTGGLDLSGLHQRFRDVLRGTGLIVLGYSGWGDRTLQVIKDALADAESLPFGLYWGAYPKPDTLSADARSLLRDHAPRAMLLAPGCAAEEVLRDLCDALGINHSKNLEAWRKRTSFVAQELWSRRAGQVMAEAEEAWSRRDLRALRRLSDVIRPLLHDVETRTTKERADLLAVDGITALAFHKLAEAEASLRRALELHRGLSDQQGEAVDCSGLGFVLAARGQLDQAVAVITRAIHLFKADGNWEGFASGLWVLGTALMKRGRLEEASSVFLQLAACGNETGDLEGCAIATAVSLACILEQGRVAEVEDACRLALHDLGESTAAVSNGQLLLVWGDVLARTRRPQEARTHYERALEQFRAIGYDLGVAEAIRRIGDTERRAGRVEEAAEALRQARQIFAEVEYSSGMAAVDQSLALLAVAQGHATEAEEYIARARELYANAQDAWGLLEVDLAEARVECAAGGVDAARQLANVTETRARHMGFALLANEAVEFLAGLPA